MLQHPCGGNLYRIFLQLCQLVWLSGIWLPHGSNDFSNLQSPEFVDLSEAELTLKRATCCFNFQQRTCRARF